MLPCIAPFIGAVASVSVITDLLCLLFVWQFPATPIHFRRVTLAPSKYLKGVAATPGSPPKQQTTTQTRKIYY
jgi:hypothetical protein